ncbi:MAG TPA: glycosyltransferase family 4 protein [Gemmatimonadaceae bacterium]
MKVVHLTDSPFYGGPERQMRGLSVELRDSVDSTILCFRDHRSSLPFIEQLNAAGIAARMIGHANPHFLSMISDVAADLRRERADLLVCHGYKADVIGWFAARRVGLPVISVSRGWTAHTLKVRAYEALDRRMLARMDAVVCVSAGQAVKVLRSGIARDRLHVIHNSVDPTRFRTRNPGERAVLETLFTHKPDVIIAAVGRLSPEKGFDQLIDAARIIVSAAHHVGIVLIGDGPERRKLEARVRAAGLESNVVFTGFRNDVDRLLPSADILVQSSYTEGLPNVVLEACAAGVPVVATDVGGTSEIIDDVVNGFLVPPADPAALAGRVINLARSPLLRQEMGQRGRNIVRSRFSFARQAAQYEDLFVAVAAPRNRVDQAEFVSRVAPLSAAFAFTSHRESIANPSSQT